MANINPRLSRLEKATNIEDETAPRAVVCWCGDDLPDDLRPSDRITWLPRKADSETEWQALCYELLDLDQDDSDA